MCNYPNGVTKIFPNEAITQIVPCADYILCRTGNKEGKFSLEGFKNCFKCLNNLCLESPQRLKFLAARCMCCNSSGRQLKMTRIS